MEIQGGNFSGYCAHDEIKIVPEPELTKIEKFEEALLMYVIFPGGGYCKWAEDRAKKEGVYTPPPGAITTGYGSDLVTTAAIITTFGIIGFIGVTLAVSVMHPQTTVQTLETGVEGFIGGGWIIGNGLFALCGLPQEFAIAGKKIGNSSAYQKARDGAKKIPPALRKLSRRKWLPTLKFV
jgi:hypothetical protein